MKRHRLYHELSYLWPLFSPPDEYADEAEVYLDVLRAKLGPGRHSILELGVGGGHLLSHLTSDHDATAIDISEEMLSLSRRLNPTVQHHLGDMRSIRLNAQFDAVLIHDAIDYMLTEDDVAATLATARFHLRPRGILFVAPDWFRETYSGKHTMHWHQDHGEITLDVAEHLPEVVPNSTIVESTFVYTLRQGDQVTIEHDPHTTGLFPRNTWHRLLRETGFEAELLEVPACEGGYGGNLFVGVRKTEVPTTPLTRAS